MNQGRRYIFFISSLIRTLPSVRESHPFGSLVSRKFADFTAGMEFHQSPKIKFQGRCKYSFATPFIQLNLYLKYNYAMMEATTPDPTVLPPSRIAKRRPSSQAIGVISSTVISTLSPGRHMSTSAGSSIVPVTSVVLK